MAAISKFIESCLPVWDETHPITNFVKSVFYFTLSVKQQHGFQANFGEFPILSHYLKIFLYSSIIELEYKLKL